MLGALLPLNQRPNFMQRQLVSVGCVLRSYYLMASVARNVLENGQVRLLRLTRLGFVSLRACLFQLTFLLLRFGVNV